MIRPWTLPWSNQRTTIDQLTGETVTPPIEIGTSRAPALASALVPTVELARAKIYYQVTTQSVPLPTKPWEIKTNRKPSSFQFLQVPDTATHNRGFDPEGFHPSCHDPARHSAVLVLGLLDNDDGSGAGRIRRLEFADIVYPVLTRREAVLLGILCCDWWWAGVFG